MKVWYSFYILSEKLILKVNFSNFPRLVFSIHIMDTQNPLISLFSHQEKGLTLWFIYETPYFCLSPPYSSLFLFFVTTQLRLFSFCVYPDLILCHSD